jgi:hypothetical protein
MVGVESMKEPGVDPRKIARTFGVLFLLTWVFAIAAGVLFEPAYKDPASTYCGKASSRRRSSL